jgi:hypothetical protein
MGSRIVLPQRQRRLRTRAHDVFVINDHYWDAESQPGSPYHHSFLFSTVERDGWT